MRRVCVALVLACLVALALAPRISAAKDVLLSVELDGRPLDKGGPSGLVHGGKVFVNVVRITKGFSGLLTFGKNDSSVQVTIRRKTVQFFVGKRAGTLNGEPATFPAAPFILNGDTYVPLRTMASLAQATLSVDMKHAVARLTSAPEAEGL
jgi:hypothetical protein